MRSFVLLASLIASSAGQAAGVTVLTYHDIAKNPAGDNFAVSVSQFRKQLEYLRRNKYQPISLSQFIKFSQGKTRLPDNAVMLTFDDGLISYQNTVVPMLAKYGYPSVLSVVSGWTDGKGTPPEYKNKLLKWKQLKQLQKSRLVEVISHSDNLHQWVVSSPQKTTAPAAITRIFNFQTNMYESEKVFVKRIRKDLLKTRSRFRKMLGKYPAALTWPYGEYDITTMNVARSVGFAYQLTLDEGVATASELPNIRRYMLLRDHKLTDLRKMLKREYEHNREQRFVEIDLDVFAHVSVENHKLLITQLVERIGSLGVNTVVVTPFTKESGKAFFPNADIPIEHDLLNGILDQIQGQLDIEQVYLRFPSGREKLNSTVFERLARSSRFNAVLFDVIPKPAHAKKIRNALKKHLPHVRLGSWNNGIGRLEISVVNGDVITSLSKSNHKVLVYVKREDFLTASGLSESLRALRKKGIKHYGFGSLNYMAGAQAPDQLVEAMAYRVLENRSGSKN